MNPGGGGIFGSILNPGGGGGNLLKSIFPPLKSGGIVKLGFGPGVWDYPLLGILDGNLKPGGGVIPVGGLN